MGARANIILRYAERRQQRRQKQQIESKSKSNKIEVCIMCRNTYNTNDVSFEQKLIGPQHALNDFCRDCFNLIMYDAEQREEENKQIERYRKMNYWQGE